MAEYTNFIGAAGDPLGSSKANRAYPYIGLDKVGVIGVNLDFSVLKGTKIGSIASISSADTLEVLSIPAGTIVQSVGYNVTSLAYPEDDTNDYQVNIGYITTNADGTSRFSGNAFGVLVNLNTIANAVPSGSGSAPIWFDQDAEIRLTFADSPGEAVIEIRALVYNAK